MATFVILTRLSSREPVDLHQVKTLASAISEKWKSNCPGVVWKDGYAARGRFDFIDIVEAEDVDRVEKAATIIRAFVHSTTDTLAAIPWRDFVAAQ